MLVFACGVFNAHAEEFSTTSVASTTSSFNGTKNIEKSVANTNIYIIKLSDKSLRDSSDLSIDISRVTKTKVVQPVFISYVISSDAGTEVYRESESIILSDTMRNTKKFSDFRVVGGNYKLLVTILEQDGIPLLHKLDFIVEPRPLNITVTIPVWAFVLMITLIASNIIYDIKKLSRRRVIIREDDYERFKRNEITS